MHIRTATGLGLVLIALTVAFLQLLATAYFLYFSLWWFDIVMHFLGGFLVGGAFIWLLRFEVPPGIRARLSIFSSTLAVILVVGVAWEVFEYLTNAYSTANYALDTALDMVMNVIGTLAAYGLFLHYGK
ncbi:MAG: hypothetical protein ACE5F4_00790 [Candidatus Paceibacteria bacterium]